MQYITPSISAFLLTILGVILAIKIFPKLGLIDNPKKYNLKREPIPYSGGIIIFIVFIVCSLIFLPITKHLVGLILATTFLTIINFIDDKYGISPYIRLLAQIISACILVFAGIGITHITNPFGGEIYLSDIQFEYNYITYNLSILPHIFTIVWVIGMTNTMNWLDGLNGLPSGIGAIGSFTLFFLSISDRVNQSEIAIMSIILGSICLGFWIFDFYPARILMGDTGSMFIGFTLGTIAIFSGGKVATAFLIMGFPILDTAWVIIRRIVNKKSPFKGDLMHFHHRLLYVGFTDRKALIFIYSICAFFGITALFLDTFGKFIAISVMTILMIIVGYYLVKKR